MVRIPPWEEWETPADWGDELAHVDDDMDDPDEEPLGCDVCGRAPCLCPGDIDDA